MKTTADAEGYKTLSTKYATVYPYNASDDSNVNNLATYKNLNYGYGDAILETSTAGNGSLSWNNNYSIFSQIQNIHFLYVVDIFQVVLVQVFLHLALLTGGPSSPYGFRAVLISK